MNDKLTVAEAAVEVLLENGKEEIWFGEPDIWHEIYGRASGSQQHPLDRWAAVRTALQRSDRFYRSCYIRAINATGTREILHPVYALKQAQMNRQ